MEIRHIRIPSINKNRPKAMINSLIKLITIGFFAFIFPKNLKNSLSGESIN